MHIMTIFYELRIEGQQYHLQAIEATAFAPSTSAHSTLLVSKTITGVRRTVACHLLELYAIP